MPARRELRYSKGAADDLVAIRLWFRQPGSGATARRRLQAIVVAVDDLRRTPCQFRRGLIVGTRRMTVERHVVIYEVIPDTGDDRTAGSVLVIGIYGPGRDWA